MRRPTDGSQTSMIVQDHENHTTALGFSRADNSTLDSARAAELYGNNIPISRRTVFRESKPYKEKTTLPRASADVSGVRIKLSLDFSRVIEKAPDTSNMKCFASYITLSPVNLIPG